MRRLTLFTMALLLSACAAPPSDGGLWAQQGQDQELAIFRQSEAARLLGARAVELELADEMIQQERSRLEAALATCPGADRQPMSLSGSNRVRDAIRIRAGDDLARLAQTAQLALADWQLRRARVNRNPEWCEGARSTLAGASSRVPDVSTTSAAAHTIAEYALGVIDANRAAAPLPRYLEVVYGGVAVDVAADLEAVDQQVSAHPEYEPDALWLSPQP